MLATLVKGNLRHGRLGDGRGGSCPHDTQCKGAGVSWGKGVGAGAGAGARTLT